MSGGVLAVQPKNSVETILTNNLNRIEEATPPGNSLEADLRTETNPEGPLTLDAQGLSLDEIADRLAQSNT
jgi:hypothetical protein